MRLIIADADIKTAQSPNEVNTVTLHIRLRSALGDKGYVGKVAVNLSDIGLARELFDAVLQGRLELGDA